MDPRGHVTPFRHRLLEIDLTSGTIAPLDVPEDWSPAFVGGRGLGARLLWERLSPGADPLAPEAEMYVLTGPLTGVAPGGAQTSLVFKSPATRTTIGHAVTGGQWGPELRACGFDGLVIRGRAPSPVYVVVTDGAAEIRPADQLWGKTTFETESLVKLALGDHGVRVLSIGPGGENLVRFASVQQEMFRSAARGGPGCVWGSKNLKAIAVRGRLPLPVARPEEAFAQHDRLHEALAASRTTIRRPYFLSRWGSSMSKVPHSDVAELDVRNYREATWDKVDSVGGLAYERRVRVRPRSCFGCPIGCMQLGMIHQGPFAGRLVNPDFDSTGTIGPGCLIEDLEALCYLSRWGDEYGLDDASLGNVTGFAMECFERGLITTGDTGGLELRWGDADAVLKLWGMILRREGIGDVLAEGVRHAAEVIGGGSEAFAMHVKGLEFAGYAPQAHPDRALQYAVGDRGGCHHYGLSPQEQDHRAWADSLLVCSWHRRVLPPEDYMSLLRPITGWDLDPDDWSASGARMLLAARAFNIREGTVPLRDDVLPERVHVDALTTGPRAGAVYLEEDFLADRQEWYADRGCDAAGIPTAERLSRLGLGFMESAMAEARVRCRSK